MTFDTKTTASLAWLLAVLAVGVVASVGSAMGWLLISILAIGPPLTLLHFSRELSLTTSQSIQKAKR